MLMDARRGIVKVKTHVWLLTRHVVKHVSFVSVIMDLTGLVTAPQAVSSGVLQRCGELQSLCVGICSSLGHSKID